MIFFEFLLLVTSIKTSYGKSSEKLKTGPKPKGTSPHNLKIEEVASQVKDGEIIAGGGRGYPPEAKIPIIYMDYMRKETISYLDIKI